MSGIGAKFLPSAAKFISGMWTWYAGAPDRNCVYRSTFFLVRHRVLPFEDIHPFTVPHPGIVEFHSSSEILARYRVVVHGRTMRLSDITPDTVRQLVFVDRSVSEAQVKRSRAPSAPASPAPEVPP